MRFRFCGGTDCQDWLLAEISMLSKLTSIKMKLLCNECVNDLIENQINFEKVVKIGVDSKLDTEDMKACVSAVVFIYSMSCKYNIESEVLFNELQQLGLPKENSSSLCRVYSENFSRLQESLKHQSLRLSRLNQISYKVNTEFIGSSHKVKAPAVQICIDTIRDHKKEKTSFYLTHEKLTVLISELKQINQSMDELITN